MKEPVRWGILSTANIGRAILRGIGLSKDSCVHAVASREWTRASEWAKEQGIPRAFGAYDDMLESGEIDVVYNPLPNSLHAEWTIKALEAGLSVLCEKPFTVNAEEARRVAAVAKRAGRVVAEAFMYRFHPIYEEVLSLVRDGAIGEVMTIRSTFAFRLEDRSNIRASKELAGGALMDVGCYCVNLARLIAGCEPIEAQAFERRTTVDDTLLGALRFPNGILSQFQCSIENRAGSGTEIVGTAGKILIEKPWFPGEDQGQIIVQRGDKREELSTPGANCYHLEIDDFVAAHRTHRTLRWPVEDAVANMAVIDALYASAREGVVAPVEQAQ